MGLGPLTRTVSIQVISDPASVTRRPTGRSRVGNFLASLATWLSPRTGRLRHGGDNDPAGERRQPCSTTAPKLTNPGAVTSLIEKAAVSTTRA
jgi:hypothetical protein